VTRSDLWNCPSFSHGVKALSDDRWKMPPVSVVATALMRHCGVCAQGMKPEKEKNEIPARPTLQPTQDC